MNNNVSSANISMVIGGASMAGSGFTTVSNAASIGINIATALPVLGLTAATATSVATLTGLALVVGGLTVMGIGLLGNYWANNY